MLDTLGTHLMVEYTGCPPHILRDIAALETLMKRAALEAGATVLSSSFSPRKEGGICGILVISESHFSIHTWPARQYAAVDFYTCGNSSPTQAHRVLCAGLQATDSKQLIVQRGLHPSQGSFRLVAP